MSALFLKSVSSVQIIIVPCLAFQGTTSVGRIYLVEHYKIPILWTPSMSAVSVCVFIHIGVYMP